MEKIVKSVLDSKPLESVLESEKKKNTVKIVYYIRTEEEIKGGETFTDFLNRKRNELMKQFGAKKVFIDVL